MKTSADFRQQRGKLAEDLACRFLERHGMKVLTRNLTVKGGEIDIVARDGKALCLVEVRSRHSPDSPYLPEAAISRTKLKRIRTAARRLMQKLKLGAVQVRLDLLVIDWKTGDPELRFHPGGFISLD